MKNCKIAKDFPSTFLYKQTRKKKNFLSWIGWVKREKWVGKTIYAKNLDQIRSNYYSTYSLFVSYQNKIICHTNLIIYLIFYTATISARKTL